jgi:hypothetical protein
MNTDGNGWRVVSLLKDSLEMGGLDQVDFKELIDRMEIELNSLKKSYEYQIKRS